MNIDQVHNPARLEGETQREYRARQKLSKRLATHMPVIHTKGTYVAGPTVTVHKPEMPK